MKKLLRWLLCAIMLLPALATPVAAATYGGLTYSVSNGEVTITDCDTSVSGSLTILAEIDGYPVTSIREGAFEYCSSITSITIPDSVTSIGICAFWCCRSLTSITIPDSVTSIGSCAFTYCSSLTSIGVSLDNPSYCSIDGVLFSKDKTKLICCPGRKFGDYIVPDSVTSIEHDAFWYCRSLTSVTIPDSVTSIGIGAFGYCSSLTSITIPDSVTSIGSSSFYGCSSLTSITIPDSVTSIEDYAFKYCSSLTSITIPDSVTSIENYAFEYCDKLTIYGYSGSTAEEYAKAHNIPFALIGGSSGLEPTYGYVTIDEQKLFTEYPQYLSNSAENYILRTAQKGYAEALSNNSYLKDVGASFLYGLQEGTNILLRQIFSSVSGSFHSNYDLFVMDTAESLLFALAQNEKATDNILSNTLEAFGNVKTVSDLSLASEKDAFAQMLAKVSPGVEKEEINKLVEEAFENENRISKAFSSVGKALDLGDFVYTVVLLESMDIELIDSLLRTIPEDSDLYGALSELKDQRTSNFAENCVKKYFDEKIISKISSKMLDVITTAGAPTVIESVSVSGISLSSIIVGVAVDIANYYLPGADDIVRTQEYASCVDVCGGALLKLQTQFITAKKNGSCVSLREISDYKIVYTAYLESMKLALESAKSLTSGSRRDCIDQRLELLDDFTYDTYIGFCLKELAGDLGANYHYTMRNGKAVITGYGTPALASGITLFAEESPTEEPANFLVIPAEIDSVPVVALGAECLNDIPANTIVIISDGITDIDEGAFRNNKNVSMILMGDSVTTIGDSAFEGCSKMTSISLSSSVSSLGSEAFKDCSALKCITVSGDIEEIGADAFGKTNATVFCDDKNTNVVNYLNENDVNFSASNPDQIPLKGIALDKTSLTLVEGESGSLTVTFDPADATNQYVSWESSDEGVAKVENGKISAVSPGTAKITVTALDEDYTATCTVTVTHKEVIDKAVAATCTKDGLTAGKHCSVCNEVLEKQEVVKALGHSWDGGVVTKKSTTTETGVKTYTCTRCKAAYTETIAKLPITIVFDDVTSGTDWFASYVNDLVSRGILNGKGTRADGTPYFEPLGLITRGEFSKILATASGDDLAAYNGYSKLSDTAGHWALPYINWAYEKGIVTGFTDGTFAPDASITREQMAVMICRYAEYKGITLPKTNEKLTFTDGNLITWSADAVYAMQQAGIINGYNENGGCYFKPQNNATRAEAAKMISCFLDL